MKRGRRRIRRRCSSSKPPLFLLHQRLAPTRQDETRLLGASFKKTDEKPTANTYATERKRLNSGSERTFGPFMHGFHMIGFQRKGALFVRYPPFGEILLVGDGDAIQILNFQDSTSPHPIDPAWRRDPALFAAVRQE